MRFSATMRRFGRVPQSRTKSRPRARGSGERLVHSGDSERTWHGQKQGRAPQEARYNVGDEQ